MFMLEILKLKIYFENCEKVDEKDKKNGKSILQTQSKINQQCQRCEKSRNIGSYKKRHISKTKYKELNKKTTPSLELVAMENRVFF